MTRDQWMTAENPSAILVHLRAQAASSRKLMLFAVACSSPVRDLEFEDDAYAALLLEKFADACLSEAETDWMGRHRPGFLLREPWVVAQAWSFQVHILGCAHDRPQSAVQTTLLRDIFGDIFDPWRGPDDIIPGTPLACDADGKVVPCRKGMTAVGVAMSRPDPEGWLRVQRQGSYTLETLVGENVVPRQWLTWQDGCIPKLADAIYLSKKWDELPLLSDALKEVGGESDLTRHLDGLVPCVPCDRCVSGWRKRDYPLGCRGDWVLDLLTGRS